MDGAPLLHFVSEPTRIAILSALRDSPCDVSVLVERTGREQSNVSHHLKRLRDAGLVRALRRGRHQEYRIADTAVVDLLERLDALGESLERAAYYARLQIPMDARFHGYG